MSLSLLYHALGLYGFHQLRSWQKGGALYLEVIRSTKRCGACSTWDVKKKGYRWRVIRLLPIGKKPVFARVKIRRFYCSHCGKIRYENISCADPKKHFTHTLEEYVMDLCAYMTIRDVAEHTGLHWATVKEIDKKRLKRRVPREKDLRKIKFLGVDEVSVRRGHNYLTVVVDLETGRVVYVGEGRRVESLSPFFKRLKRIGVRPKAIAMDMWKPYAKAVRLYYRGLPLVYDTFHVLADYSRTLNKIRVDEANKLEGTPEEKVIKGTRYLLLKGQEKLSLRAQERLWRLLRINQPIFIAYVLKEELRRLWKMPSRQKAEKFLNEWIRMAFESGVLLLARFARKLFRHAWGILNYFDFPISTAKVEGTNNRIKVIKRRAYGYRDLEYFKLKIYNLYATRYSLL
ncbi:MAG: ISL3 family transposase [Candidatus Aminicenantes bacterium]|nr:ISL3 family transposase [Candidatus Aminicenantes bacterium]